MISDELERLSRDIASKQRSSRLAAHSRPWKPTATPASILGYRCERRIVYTRLWPDDAAGIGEELASIFDEGNLHEREVRVELAKLGFEVVESESSFRDEHLDVVGHIDGKLILGEKFGRRIPAELKSTVGDGPRDADDWKDNARPLYRRYYAQLSLYLYLTNAPEGIGIFKDKITGLINPVPIAFDYDALEPILQRAERIRDAVRLIKAAGDDEDLRRSHLPLRIPDRSECNGCPFRDTICHPADVPIDPLLVSNDIDLLSKLDEMERIAPMADRYKEIEKEVKSRVKLTMGDRFIVGERWLITKKKRGNGERILFERI